jgi:ABC-type glycerol-3-phosphate transport system substrate-binding protein
MSVKQCAAKGLIEELTPYYEKDEELRVEDMLPEVYEAEMEAGGLYYVAPSFGLTTLMGRTEDVGDGKGWTVADLKAMMDKKGEDARLFSYKDDRMYYLDMFLCNSISDYVDWDKGVCNFDSDDFRYLLELSYSQGTKKEQEMTDAEIMENVDTQYSRFRDGEYLLIDEDEVSLHMLQFEREAIGVPLNYIGYPNKEGEGSYFDFGEMYAISSRSENKELAWEFLRGLLSEEHQKKEAEANDSVMPVMKDCFDKRMKAMTTTKTYIDEFGETVEPEEEYDFSWGDYSTKIGVPKEEDVKLYMDILHRTKHAKMYDGTVLGIVYEEAQDYFSDRKKLDKTIDVIQKRVTTYINEQKQ